MNLYRCTYQATRSGPCRRATFAACDDEQARKFAYYLRPANALPLVVKPLRPLSVQLTLRMA